MVALFVGTAFVEAVNDVAPTTLGGGRACTGSTRTTPLVGGRRRARGLYLGLIMLIVLIAAFQLSRARAAEGHGARCTTTRWPPRS